MNYKIVKCFNVYKEDMFRIDNDISFWRNFLNHCIKNYSENPESMINTAIFCVYDHQYNDISGFLKSHDKTYETKVSDIPFRREEFFNWILNLAILKSYNSLEILLLQAINIKYFPDLNDPLDGRRETEQIRGKIKESLIAESIKFKKDNNDYILKYLSLKSPNIHSFLKLNMNVDLNTTWKDFFLTLSIIRNIVTHNSMIIQQDTLNAIKSKSKDIFERHFDIKQGVNGFPILYTKEDVFGELITKINSLGVNLYKFVFNESDFSFLGLK